MANIALLNRQTHRGLRVLAGASAALGDGRHFVPVVVDEFPQLAVHYPILLSKDSETGAFYCGAMLGFDPEENLFLTEGLGFDGYRPLNLQREPFFTAGDDLAVDLDSPRLSEEAGEFLFDEAGEPTPYLRSVVVALQQLKPGVERTTLFIEKLLALKLIEPIDIDVGFDDGSTRQLAGLYTVNRETLQELPDDAVLELFRRGYLQLIYLILASLKQVAVLAQRKNRRILAASETLSGSGA